MHYCTIRDKKYVKLPSLVWLEKVYFKKQIQPLSHCLQSCSDQFKFDCTAGEENCLGLWRRPPMFTESRYLQVRLGYIFYPSAVCRGFCKNITSETSKDKCFLK